jgi:hypothetical protein
MFADEEVVEADLMHRLLVATAVTEGITHLKHPPLTEIISMVGAAKAAAGSSNRVESRASSIMFVSSTNLP